MCYVVENLNSKGPVSCAKQRDKWDKTNIDNEPDILEAWTYQRKTVSLIKEKCNKQEKRSNLFHLVELEKVAPLSLRPDSLTLRVHLGILVSGPNRVKGIFGLLAFGIVSISQLNLLVPACSQEKGDIVEVLDGLVEYKTIAGSKELELDCLSEVWQGHRV